MVFKTLPDVIGGHGLTDYVGVVGGDVKKASGAEAVIVHEGDIADEEPMPGTEDAELGIALLFEQWRHRRASWTGLAIGLEREAGYGGRRSGRARSCRGPCGGRGRDAHLGGGMPRTLIQCAETVLVVPFGVPNWGGRRQRSLLLPGKSWEVGRCLFFGPGEFEGIEGEDTFFSTRGRKRPTINAVVVGRVAAYQSTA